MHAALHGRMVRSFNFGALALPLKTGGLVANTKNNREHESVGGNVQIEIRDAVDEQRQGAPNAAERDRRAVSAGIR